MGSLSRAHGLPIRCIIMGTWAITVFTAMILVDKYRDENRQRKFAWTNPELRDNFIKINSMAKEYKQLPTALTIVEGKEKFRY